MNRFFKLVSAGVLCGKSVPGGIAPLYSSSEIGTVNGYTVVVTFDMNISASNYATGVTIKENGVATAITSATRQANHAVVHYEIPIPWHGSDDVITWEYTGGNIVSEADATVLGTVTAQTVTNNITWSMLSNEQSDDGLVGYIDNTPLVGGGTITQSVNIITGTGSDFFNQVVIGDRILADDSSIDGIVTEIVWDSATSLTVDSTATVETGKTYTIIPQTPYAERILSWNDLTSNAHDFSNSFRAARPILQTVEGNPSVFFNPVINGYRGTWLIGDDYADNLSDTSVFIVYRYDGSGGNFGYTAISKIGQAYSADAGWLFFVEFEIGLGIISDVDNFRQVKIIDVPITNLAVASGEILSFSDSHVYYNGDNTDEQPTTAGTVTTTSNAEPVRIGATGFETNGQTFSGWLCAVMIATPHLPSADRAALEQRLADRYGITL